MVPFNKIPTNIRTPLFFAEVDNSQGNSAVANQRGLIIGQILAGGAGVPNIPVISQGVGDAAIVGGVGSMLHLMTAAVRQNDQAGEYWYLPLADDGAAVAAAGSILTTTAPTSAGVLSIYIAGVKISVSLASGMTAAQVATAIAAAITATPNLPVSVAIPGGTPARVDITALNKGPAGNDIDIRFNYGGTRAGEQLPAGYAATITAMAAGATAPSLAAGLANLGDQSFDFIICPYTDTTSLDAIKNLLNDNTGRWSYSQQLYGHGFAALRGTYGALVTAGDLRNDPHFSIMGFYDSPTPSWIWSPAYAAAAAASLRNDPGQPLQTVVINGVLAPPVQSRFPQFPNRNNLLFNGISTFTVADDGTVAIENLITTYQKNAFAQPDDSYLQIETMFELMFALRFLRTRITSKFARFKLADNGTAIPPGSNIVTPNVIKGDQIAAFKELELFGVVQKSADFAALIIVERNAQNPNRVDVLWPGTFVNQLRIFALLAQFRLK